MTSYEALWVPWWCVLRVCDPSSEIVSSIHSVLRARRLVGVRGAGTTFDGFYWVKQVTHTIKSGSYTQGFKLSREGTGALLPVVAP